MFSFLKKKSLVKRAVRKVAFVGAVLVLLTSFFFVSCADPDDGNDAQAPSITVQPVGGNWDVFTTDTFSLTVTATSPDSGTLNYQWYSNTSASNSGGSAIGTNSATLNLAKANFTENKNYYFYVVVTNTNNSVSGTNTAAKTSNTATVTVVSNSILYLNGTWYSANNGIDFFIIDTNARTFEYASGWGQDGTFVGKILEVATGSSGTGVSGVIYIEFTKKPNSYSTGQPVSGNFTGIYFDAVQSTTSQGFYLPLDGSYEPITANSLAEVKDTLDPADLDNYVSFNIEYAKISGGNGGVHSSLLEGTWIDDYDTIFTITKTTIVSAMEYGGYNMPFFAGDIFKVVTKSATEGYIVFRYVGVYDDDLIGTYSVLYWKGLTASGVEMAIAGDDYSGGMEEGEATATAAETKYSSGNTSDFDFTDFEKQ